MPRLLRGSAYGARGAGHPPVIDERAWLSRREVLRSLGYAGLAATLGGQARGQALGQGSGHDGMDELDAAEEDARRRGFSPDSYPSSERWVPEWEPAGGAERYPAQRNRTFRGGRGLTPEDKAAKWNNFYEFLPGKAGAVYKRTKKFEGRPWPVRIGGLVKRPRTVELDELASIAPLEERILRHRCVEAWSMVVPWTGFELRHLIDWCEPKPEATHVRFVSFLDRKRAPGFKQARHYPWPYYEGLRLDEARIPVAMLATGIFGHGLPAQHGAPVRVIAPWKYGYKSPKSLVSIEFVSGEPPTFWNDQEPDEYSFLSNVDPKVPHPRWSQATERDIATGDRIKTLPYNGYGAQVAHLYQGS